MRNRSLELIFHLSFIAAFICFVILFYFEIKNIFLTYYIVLTSIILLISKLLYWNIYKVNKLDIKKEENNNIFFARLAICIFTYITPVYCIIQEPYLIVNSYISFLTYVIVVFLIIIGILIDKWLFFKDSQEFTYEKNI